MQTDEFVTTGQAAFELRQLEWKVRRAYTTGLLPEPPRVGVSRMIRREDLPELGRVINERWPEK